MAFSQNMILLSKCPKHFCRRLYLSSLSCLKGGQRYPLDKSLSTGSDRRRLKQYLPNGMTKVVSLADSGEKPIGQKPELASNLLKMVAPAS